MSEPSPQPVQLLLEQRWRWRRGDRVRIEDYLAQYPALHSDDEAVLDLVCNEIDLREESGEAPELAEYLERFPQFAAQLGALFEVHRALRPAPPAGATVREGERAAPEAEPPVARTRDLPAV